ncbi:MAG: hypothetical protein V4519_01325 [Patescibacteria group bacterium]
MSFSIPVLMIGLGLVLLQAVCAYLDGFLTQAQMRRRGIMNGYSFMEHGGMWADVFVITPLVAFIMGNYKLPFYTGPGIITMMFLMFGAIGLGMLFSRQALEHPEAHTHDGQTTAAGWVHGLYAVFGLSVCVLFYLFPVVPQISTRDLLIVSSILTLFFPLGMMKFSKQWKPDRNFWIFLSIEVVALWSVTLVRMKWT